MTPSPQRERNHKWRVTSAERESGIAFFVMTGRGLEQIAADELRRLTGVTVTETGYRRVTGVLNAPLECLLHLRTVDDAFLDIATIHGLAPHRHALGDLTRALRTVNLHGAVEHCRKVRTLGPRPPTAVSVSFVGSRNYSSPEIKEAVQHGLTDRDRWSWCERDDEAELNVRVFIEHDIAYVGVRLSRTPLHHRAWQHVHLPGALRPSIAAAMVCLANVRPGMSILDPCCGTGTLLVESRMVGGHALGGDSNPNACRAARHHLAASGFTAPVVHWDARRLPLGNASIDRIVTNLPWDRQIGLTDPIETDYRSLSREMERVLAPQGRAVVLTTSPHLLRLEAWKTVSTIPISVSGQTPHLVALTASSP